MSSFENYVEGARGVVAYGALARGFLGPHDPAVAADAVSWVVCALEALARERAGEAETPSALLARPTYGPAAVAAHQAARDAEPRSYSHWGMH